MLVVYLGAILCVCFRCAAAAQIAAQLRKCGAKTDAPTQKRRSLRLLSLAHPPPRPGTSGTISPLPTDAAWSYSSPGGREDPVKLTINREIATIHAKSSHFLLGNSPKCLPLVHLWWSHCWWCHSRVGWTKTCLIGYGQNPAPVGFNPVISLLGRK